jgi:hypothetical protein
MFTTASESNSYPYWNSYHQAPDATLTQQQLRRPTPGGVHFLYFQHFPTIFGTGLSGRKLKAKLLYVFKIRCQRYVGDDTAGGAAVRNNRFLVSLGQAACPAVVSLRTTTPSSTISEVTNHTDRAHSKPEFSRFGRYA